MKVKNVVIPIGIDPKTKKEFHRICVDNDESMANVLRKCVKNYIDEHKPRYVQVG